MRLIDANALKEEVNKKNVVGRFNTLLLIDNAPTVSFMISPDYVTELQNRNKELIKQLEEVERPQGEWNYIQAGMCVCPFCGAMPHKLYKDFCANCGAKMKGGAEELK
jgi:hypothetical protein